MTENLANGRSAPAATESNWPTFRSSRRRSIIGSIVSERQRRSDNVVQAEAIPVGDRDGNIVGQCSTTQGPIIGSQVLALPREQEWDEHRCHALLLHERPCLVDPDGC